MAVSDVKHILKEIADILEIQGENPFKIRAYRRAMQVIDSRMPEIEGLAEREELSSLPGIGSELAQKIGEIIATGKLDYHDRLREEIPGGLLGMLDVPGMGPKKVKLVWEALDIDTLAQLKSAGEGGLLKKLPGMGAKSEEKVLKGIEFIERHQGRITLGEALPIAEKIAGYLAAETGVKHLHIAGSLRRGRETIGDIDILCVAAEPKKVMDRFVKLKNVREGLAHGATKSSVRLEEGIQADLRIVEKESLGAALQYFSGSQAHNIQLRAIAKKRGLKLNEYGLFREKDDKRLAGATEEEVYKALGLPWIPPELREGLDEIERAAADDLPKLIELSDIRGDLHAHTHWSDGKATIEEMASAARDRGYSYLTISDHSQSLIVGNGLPPERLAEQIRAIREYNNKTKGFCLFAGTEVDILSDGRLDYPDELLAECDFVVASIHTGFSQSAKQINLRIRSAMENPYVNVIAHPTGRLLNKREPYAIDMETLFKDAAKTGTALELNGNPKRLDLCDSHLRGAARHGIPIIVTTDAHAPVHLDFMRYGILTARRAGLTADDVLNTLSITKLRKALERKRK